MEGIGHRPVIHYFPFTDWPLPMGGLNIITVTSSLLAMVLLWAFLYFSVRRFAMVPGRAQAFVELVVDAFDDLVRSSMELGDKAKERHFLPLILSLFLYIALSNAIVLLPFPHIEEPTADINTTLGLALLSVGYSLYCAIKHRGPIGFVEEMLGPMWHEHSDSKAVALLYKLSAVFFFPLKVVEEIARVISLSCRLFGNILGGAMIIAVVGYLTCFVGIPLALDAFILVFEALLQAFVFSILTLMYISTAIKE